MRVRAVLADLAAAAREHPVAVGLEVGTLAACIVLVLGTIGALASGPPTGRGGPWLGVIVLGAAVSLLWTVAVPLYDRLLA